jgi:hypothetical protein
VLPGHILNESMLPLKKLYPCLWGVGNHSDMLVLQETDHEVIYSALYVLA